MTIKTLLLLWTDGFVGPPRRYLQKVKRRPVKLRAAVHVKRERMTERPSFGLRRLDFGPRRRDLRQDSPDEQPEVGFPSPALELLAARCRVDPRPRGREQRRKSREGAEVSFRKHLRNTYGV